MSASPMPRSDAGARAPEFPAGLDWLNVGRPLALSDLEGRLALIEFWTAC